MDLKRDPNLKNYSYTIMHYYIDHRRSDALHPPTSEGPLSMKPGPEGEAGVADWELPQSKS